MSDLPPPSVAASESTAPPAAGAPPRPGPGRGYDRVPPHSLEAEVSALGAALLSRNAASEVVELLRPDDLYRTAHRVVFEGLRELMSRGEPVDAVTLLDWLARNDRLDEVGGPGAIHDLTDAVPTAANAAFYARIVREKALLRRLIDAGTAVARLGYESAEDATTVVDRAEALVYEVAQTGSTSDYAELKDLLNESFAEIERLSEKGEDITGLATGYDDLDRLTAGLQPSNLVIVAARPAMGKCVSGALRVLDAHTGAYRSVAEIVADRGGGDLAVLAVDGRHRLAAATPADYVDNGVRATFRMRTRLGRQIEVTANHPLLTPVGWRELHQLEPDDLVAVPRRLGVFGRDVQSHAGVVLLAYLLDDGCLRGSHPALVTASDAVEAEARELAPAFGTRITTDPRRGTTARTLGFPCASERVTRSQVATRAGVSLATVHVATTGSQAVATPTKARAQVAARSRFHTGLPSTNRLTEWLREVGLWGLDSHGKFVPDLVFRLPKQQLATFLSRLFATHGSAWVAEGHGQLGIGYCSLSERLVRDVAHLLLRFGIIARIRERQVEHQDGHRRAFELEIRDAEHVLRFADEIGIFSKEDAVSRVVAAARARGPHTDTDLLPIEVWDTILAEKGQRSWAEVSEASRRPRNHDWHVHRRRPSRCLVAELAETFDSDRLRAIASSDVCWDEIVAIEPAGEQRVYDLEIPELHSFVADDIVVHNSSLAMGVAKYVTADLRRPAAIFSLEMSRLEIVSRLLSSEARIDSRRIRTGQLEESDWRKLSDALGKLSEAPLFIDDTPAITLMEIRSKCRRIKQRHGLELVIVDYLQLMQSHRRADNRQQEVAEISRGLKMLAKELEVPVLALSQLSRQPEARTDKRPLLADLRESGSLEQDSDIVGFIYRDEVYDANSPDKGIAELIIAKHRNGATGVVKLAFLDHLTTFANLARGATRAPTPPPGEVTTPV